MTPRERLADARLYLVCDARPRAFLDAALRGGANLIQLRDKSLSDEGLIDAARVFRERSSFGVKETERFHGPNMAKKTAQKRLVIVSLLHPTLVEL